MGEDVSKLTLTRKNVAGSDDWLVIRSDDLEELVALDAAAGAASSALRENRGLYNAALMAAPQAVTPPQASSPAYEPPATHQQAPPPVPPAAPPVAQPSGAPPGVPAPTCIHGQRKYLKNKPESPKKWEGWFCPTPKGTPDQCDPVWVGR